MSSPADFSVLILTPDVMRRYAAEAGGPERVHLQIAQTQDLGFYRTFRALFTRMGGAATSLERQSLLAETLRLLLERGVEGRPDPGPAPGAPWRLRRMRDYLHAHADQDVSLDRLAEVAGISRFHALRSFTRAFGCPPHAYQIQLRVARARGLLARRIPIAHVALDVGFYDQSHFGTHFKRILGVTPAAYAGK